MNLLLSGLKRIFRKKEGNVIKKQTLIESVVAQLKPIYKSELAKGRNPTDAYQKIYLKAVHLVSRQLGISRSKTEFEARATLQKIIQEVMA